MTLMEKETSFRHVDTFSDDAITVRVTRVEGQLIGVIDFPSFRRDGKMIAASGIKPRPFVEAIAVAERILPHTPFPEIVILAHADLGEATESAVFRPDDVTLSNTGAET
uniref:Uncharacterized protein n=1 Tax=viral metagenome TaxID=1070528 RepID=A0A6M3XCE9_9ZZZZ